MKEATQIQDENAIAPVAQDVSSMQEANTILVVEEKSLDTQEEKSLSESFKAETTYSDEFVSPLTYDYLSGIGVLLFMLFALYFVLWAMKKYGKGKFIPFVTTFNREDLKVEARVPLDGKKTLYVVKYLNKRLLIGGADSSLTLLSEDYYFDEEAESKNDEKKLGTRQDFKETVQQFKKTLI